MSRLIERMGCQCLPVSIISPSHAMTSSAEHYVSRSREQRATASVRREVTVKCSHTPTHTHTHPHTHPFLEPQELLGTIQYDD